MYGTVVRSDLTSELPQVVADPGLFDLDDLGTEVSKQPSGLVAGRQDGAFEDPDTLQELDHAAPHPSFTSDDAIARVIASLSNLS
jgi:hypothetical protein